jgi:hypothetical protein
MLNFFTFISQPKNSFILSKNQSFIEQVIGTLVKIGKLELMQGSQTQIEWRATFQQKMLRGPQFTGEKLMPVAKY